MNATCTYTHQYLSDGGTIKSSAYPECYPVYKTCTWNLSVPIGFEIRIEPFSYGIEDSDGCKYDYLSIYDDISALSAPTDKMCGRDTYYGSTSTGRNLFIEFYSDAMEVAEGFQIRLFVIGMKRFILTLDWIT